MTDEEERIPIKKTSFNCPVPLLRKIESERKHRNQPDKTSVIIDALNFYFENQPIMESLHAELMRILLSELSNPNSELVKAIRESLKKD